MVKPRRFVYALIVLGGIVLGGILVFLIRSSPNEPAEFFPSTVNLDCAPWDGPAFTVFVQYDPGTMIIISFWQPPNIPYRSTFSFPDEDGQMGNAYLAPALGSYAALNGEVMLQRVSADKPVEGSFRLTSEGGDYFEGRFEAEWDENHILCG